MVGSHFTSSQPSLPLAPRAHSLVTHHFHPVARCCRDVPGALFPAGILVRPVGTAHHPLCTAQLVLAASLGERNCIRASLTWQPCSVLHGPLCPLGPSTGQTWKASDTKQDFLLLCHSSGGFVLYFFELTWQMVKWIPHSPH